MQFDGLYKERKPLQMGGQKIEKSFYVEPFCIKDLKLFMNVCSSARPKVVLFPDLVPLFMIHLVLSPLT